MKPTLKTTALAMCIALSLTACKSTSNSGDARPTAVQPEAAKAEAAAKEAAAKEAATKEAAAKAEAAAKEAAAKEAAAKEAAAKEAAAKAEAAAKEAAAKEAAAKEAAAKEAAAKEAAAKEAAAKAEAAAKEAAAKEAAAKEAAAKEAAAKEAAAKEAAAKEAAAKEAAAKEAAAKEAAAKEAAAKEAAAKEAAAKEAAAKEAAAKEAAAKEAAAKEAKPAASSYDDLKKLFDLPVVDGKYSDLVDATYNGKVFAKVKLSNTDEERYSQTTIDEDGDVTLNVQKNSSDKFKMSGTIDSKTVGSIQLGEKEIIENKVKDGHVDFGDDADGKYSATISKDGDIVGRVEYNSRRAIEDGFYPSFEGKDGATKYLFGYEAFFDATKQPK